MEFCSTSPQIINISLNLPKASYARPSFNVTDKYGSGNELVQYSTSNKFTCRCGLELKIRIFLEERDKEHESDNELKIKEEILEIEQITELNTEVEVDQSEEDSLVLTQKSVTAKKNKKLISLSGATVTRVPRGPNDNWPRTVVERKLNTILTSEDDFQHFYNEYRVLRTRTPTPYLEIIKFPDKFKLYIWKPRPNTYYMTSFDTHSDCCDICQLPRKSPAQLILHRAEHFYNRDLLRCYGCQLQFDKIEEIQRHVAYCRHNTRLVATKCNVCGLEFSSIRLLKLHEKSHIKDLSLNRTALCEICCKWFPDSLSLRRHQKHKHKIDSMECHHCGRKYPMKHDILQHLVKKHFPALAAFRCTQCSYVSSIKNVLDRHVRMVHNREMMAECSECGKTMQQTSLKLHMSKHRSHLERKKFLCPVCNKIFFSESSRQSHLNSVHTDPETWEHLCKSCGKRFPTKDKLNRHVKEYHTQRPTCTICHKAFTTKVYLKDHYNLHTGQRPYKCSVCERAFADRGCLRNHLKHHETSMGVKLTLNKEEARLKRLNVKFDI